MKGYQSNDGGKYISLNSQVGLLVADAGPVASIKVVKTQNTETMTEDDFSDGTLVNTMNDILNSPDNSLEEKAIAQLVLDVKAATATA